MLLYNKIDFSIIITNPALLKYMELSGARKEETVYIGDSASDMACALNAGVDCVHAVWGEPETEADATYRAGKPEQLEEIFL